MKWLKVLAPSLLLLCIVELCAHAQVVPGGAPSAPNPPTSSISGSLQTATGGAVTNGTLNFTLSQPAIVSGTSSVASNTVSCYTSTSGNIVGVPDPLAAPVLSANLVSGTLPAATYFVEFVYVGPGGTKSVPSPEAQINLASPGTLNVNAPAIQPAAATGFYAVYIGTTSGAETLQGTVTSWTTFAQSTPLVVGSALPVSNNTSCNVWFSDTLIPTGTFYTVSLVNRNGSLIAGFPQTWCTFGGAGGTINVSQGAPTGNCGTNGVFYPTPIFAVPANGSQQSISGPLGVSSLTVTSLNNIKFADQFSSVQAAISSLPSSGGTVYLTCGSSYTGPTVIPTGVKLESTCLATPSPFAPYTTTLNYASALTIGPSYGIAIKGITLSFSSGNLIFNGVSQSYFDMAVNCVTSSPCFAMDAVADFSSFDRFHYLDITTGGAIGMQLMGTAPKFVTDNTFDLVLINMTRATLGAITEAIGFNANSDSNHFNTLHLFFTNVNVGNGVVFNDSATPAVDVDADNEIIDLLDFTSGPAITGTAIQINRSTGNMWLEGFGTTSFSTVAAADGSTHYTRVQVDGSAISFGASGINSGPGNPAVLLTLPSVGTAVISDTATQTLTNKTLTSPALTTPTIGGGTAVNLYKTATDTPGAITVNAQTCTDRSVAVSGTTATATIQVSAGYAMDANIVVGPGQATTNAAHYRICNVTGGNITLNAAAAFNLSIIQ